MTSRERWLNALRMEPLDRLPFWAKLGDGYPGAQTERFRSMSLPEMHEWMGSEPHAWLGAALCETRSRTRQRVTKSDQIQTIEFETPTRTLKRVDQWDQASRSWHPMEFPLHTQEDLEVLTEWTDDTQVEVDQEALRKVRDNAIKLRKHQVLATSIGTSPLMEFLQHLAGVDRGQYLLADYPAKVAGLFAAMHRVLCRKTEILCETTPADFLYLTENTSTTLHSLGQFREHALPLLREYVRVAAAYEKPVVLHMCGHLKALLPDLETLPVAGFEAFTTSPVGNTTLQEGRAACPRKCLIGGTNAALWLRPASQIIATLERDLAGLPHHRGLVLSSAGVMPPAAAPETIQAVSTWIHAYPANFTR